MIYNTLCKTGNWGPVITFGTSLYLLRDKGKLLYYYIVGLFANTIINILLKITIQEPRPGIDVDTFKLISKRPLFKHGIPDIFGMPSGHTQSIVFSTVYVFLSLKQGNVLFFYALASILTMWQRVECNYHTVLQVVVGSAVGCAFAYFVYTLARKNIMGLIRARPDDNAFF
jgi:membrane-associated phospholipid phosphatase